MTSLFEKTYNPDVLSCIANLSNDEVFTPPEVANQMLDLLPKEIWSDPSITILDPACKSGVFLREAAKRLIEGLSDEFPNLEERLEHIFKHQLYGIAITELTSLLSRRSVYCSKYPMSRYSVVEFNNPEGNIDYKRLEHSWVDGRCSRCGAAESEYERGSELETYAYEFIHLDNPEEVFGMKFDVIIGNPPYQLSTAGDQNGAQAKPIYHRFIEQAKKLNPHYMTMIIPSRWFAGGWGLDEFRANMMEDRHLKELHDFPQASDCFPGVEIKGGVCYFLRDFHYEGDTEFITHSGDTITSRETRPLKEKGCDIVIRYNEAIPILRKVQSFGEDTFETIGNRQN